MSLRPKIIPIPIAFLFILLSVTLEGASHPGKVGATEMPQTWKSSKRGWEDTGAELVPPPLGDLQGAAANVSIPARAPALATVLPKSPMVPSQVAPCAPAVPVSPGGLGVP